MRDIPAKHYSRVREDSDDRGKAAYKALLIGGSSGFNLASSEPSAFVRKMAEFSPDAPVPLFQARSLRIVQNWYEEFPTGSRISHQKTTT